MTSCAFCLDEFNPGQFNHNRLHFCRSCETTLKGNLWSGCVRCGQMMCEGECEKLIGFKYLEALGKLTNIHQELVIGAKSFQNDHFQNFLHQFLERRVESALREMYNYFQFDTVVMPLNHLKRLVQPGWTFHDVFLNSLKSFIELTNIKLNLYVPYHFKTFSLGGNSLSTRRGFASSRIHFSRTSLLGSHQTHERVLLLDDILTTGTTLTTTLSSFREIYPNCAEAAALVCFRQCHD